MQEIELFDVDGTLTLNKEDRADPQLLSVYSTFAYWELLTMAFSPNPAVFMHAAIEWNKTVTPANILEASIEMMKRTITQFMRPLTAAEMRERSREITRNLLLANVIQLPAINYIKYRLEQGVICILTTGSYLDGLYGFVDMLQEAGLLPHSPNLILHGAEVDWQNRKLLHANISENKTNKVLLELTQRNITNYTITRAFGDSPNGNDSGILALAKTGYVIASEKNLIRNYPYERFTWQVLLQQLQQLGLYNGAIY